MHILDHTYKKEKTIQVRQLYEDVVKTLGNEKNPCLLDMQIWMIGFTKN